MIGKRSSMILGCGLTALVVGAAAAEAVSTRSVDVGDNFFSPASTAAAEGDSVKWTNQGVQAHTTTSTITGAVGWNSTLSAGATFTKQLPAAGTYAYHCTFHSMTGKVKVRLQVTPSSGPVGTTFTVSVAKTIAPSGYTYAPQVKRPGSTRWKSLGETTATSVTYDATTAGKYSFRSRVKHGTLAGTDPSPVTSVTVS